jgi:nucleoside triphosphatase
MNKIVFPRGIELVTSAIIHQKHDGTILLARSPKWSNKWTLPGGHIEPGETLFESVEREVQEETGLTGKALKIISHGELINSADFHRPAHFVYFDILLETFDKNVDLDKAELTEYGWFNLSDALKLDLADSYLGTLEKYSEYLKNI